jgi:electron transfer flavoprotein beta subunit
VNQNLADLGIAASEVGEASAWTKVNDFALRPARSAGIKVVDEGNGGNELISFLAEKKLV